MSTGIFLRALKKAVERTGKGSKDVEVLRGTQRGVFELLESMLVVSWVYPRDDDGQRSLVEGEVQALVSELPVLVERLRIDG